MKSIFDKISFEFSKNVTKNYSTSFSTAVKMLAPKIRQDIYNIYGFVRFADEIVDTFHEYDKAVLFNLFEEELYEALKYKISLNPILNSFQKTVYQYDIPIDLIKSFMKSMRMDLHKSIYETTNEYNDYIYGSADVVGLMCLKVFVDGDNQKYEELKSSAMRLGSAFQKVNFLRDLKADYENLNRSYFPNTNLSALDENSKIEIIKEIEEDFEKEILENINQFTNKSRIINSFHFERLLNLKTEMGGKIVYEGEIDRNSRFIGPVIILNSKFTDFEVLSNFKR